MFRVVFDEFLKIILFLDIRISKIRKYRSVFSKTHFSDLDEMLESLVGWDLDFLPLEKGSFPSRIGQYLFEDTYIGEANFFKRVEQRGSTPSGYRTFVVPENDHVNYFWRGREINGQTLSLFPPDGELYHIHRHGDLRPIEIDPSRFRFSGQADAIASSALRIRSALQALAGGAGFDASFGLEPPALAPSASDPGEEAKALLGSNAARPRNKGPEQLLDNLGQFRFHSSWRSAVRRRAR